MAPAVGAHAIDCTDLASSPAYRAFKEVPLAIAVLLLVWAQYTFAVSLCLNYLVLVSRETSLALLLLVPFELCWWNAVLNLALCIARGPGFVGRWDSGEAGKRSEDDYRDPRAAEDEAHAPLLAQDHDPAASSSSLPPYPIRSRSHSPAEPGGLEFSEALRSIPPSPNVAADSWMCKSDGSRRFCRKCQVYKPDRSHHCSSCGRCVLKMDHHCPWLGGRCVGIANHKSFLLFISYTSLAAVFGALAAAKGLSDFVSSPAINDGFELGPLNWAFLLLIGGLFALVLGGFTAYHFYLVSVNRTTIENMERSLRVRPSPNSADYALLRPHRPGTSITGDSFPPTTYPRRPPAPGPGADALPDYGVPVYKSDDVLSRDERRKLERAAAQLNLYDLGSGRENWREVMGRDSKWWEWLLPTRPRGTSDGFSFRVNRRHLERLRELTAEIRLVPTDRTHELRYERP